MARWGGGLPAGVYVTSGGVEGKGETTAPSPTQNGGKGEGVRPPLCSALGIKIWDPNFFFGISRRQCENLSGMVYSGRKQRKTILAAIKRMFLVIIYNGLPFLSHSPPPWFAPQKN